MRILPDFEFLCRFYDSVFRVNDYCSISFNIDRSKFVKPLFSLITDWWDGSLPKTSSVLSGSRSMLDSRHATNVQHRYQTDISRLVSESPRRDPMSCLRCLFRVLQYSWLISCCTRVADRQATWHTTQSACVTSSLQEIACRQLTRTPRQVISFPKEKHKIFKIQD